MNDSEPVNDTEVQIAIDEAVKSLAPDIIGNAEARAMLSKHFSEENPYTKYAAIVFKTTSNIFESRIRETRFGFWEEVKTKTYKDEELEEQRLKFGRMVYDYGENFSADDLDVVAFTWNFRDLETQTAINSDFKFVGALLIACFLYMTFHTGSIFISFISMLNIFMSIPVALVIYTYVMQVTYFSSLHLSVAIIIIGIGADDIFVFHDFWKNTF